MNTLHPRFVRWLTVLAVPVVAAPFSRGQNAPTAPVPTTASSAKDVPMETTVEPATITKALKLEEVKVLGSRIRRLEVEGPSPVVTYDREYIRATGAMTVADFLNYLPQNYAGIGAGRGSAPNELNPEFGQRTESGFPATNIVLGLSAAGPGQTGVSGVSLRGLGSGSTLVLVDGRRRSKSALGNRSTISQQGFVDLNGIPLGMVDRVELTTDGASAIYGADAVAGVVNIILKKNWTGSELTGAYRGAFHGGGRERSLNLSSGLSKGKLRLMLALDYYDRSDLKADERAFSKNQDHRGVIAAYDATGAPITGRDLRVNWGYPSVVQARTGTLNGFFRPDGVTPTNVALTPEGYTVTPPLSAFTGAGVVPPNTNVFASGQRRGNTAAFLDLIPESERTGFSGRLNYDLSPQVELFSSFIYSNGRGSFGGQPAVSSAATSSGFGNFATIVPADYNPFGQDVAVGMIHYGFGAITQRTRNQSYSFEAGAKGTLLNDWQWEGVYTWGKETSSRINRDFNGAAITAALANPDASQRLNPFTDVRAGASPQTAIYERMALYNTIEGEGQAHSFEVTADGSLFELPGGEIKAAVGAVYLREENESVAVNNSIAVTPVVTTRRVDSDRDHQAAFAETSIPLIGRNNTLPAIRSLSLQLAGRYENYERAGDVFIPKVGLSWVPIPSVLLRGSYSEGFRAPALTEYQVATSTSTSTLVDPKRTPASTTGVSVLSGSQSAISSETSETIFYGVVIEPVWVKGLTLQVNYYSTKQQDVVQQLNAQTIINNEALFADRIVRAAPDPAVDGPLNQPGRILSVNQTLINFGSVKNESVDFDIAYQLPSQDFGRWRLGFNATRTLESIRVLGPNQPPVIDDGDTYAPPKWKYTGSVMWTGGPWNASAFISYIDSFRTNQAGNSLTFTYGVPSVYKVDVRGGYDFRRGVWRGYGKGLRVSVGIGNVFDEEPPFSDTVFGFNGGLHSAYALGRSYDLSFTLPF